MAEDLNVDHLVARQESPSTLIRFEDQTDLHAPRLNYAVPLPGSFSGKLYVETDFLNDELPWKAAAREDRRKTVLIKDLATRLSRGETPPLPLLSHVATLPVAKAPRRPEAPSGFVERSLIAARQQSGERISHASGAATLTAISSLARDDGGRQPLTQLALQFDGIVVGFDQIAAEAEKGRAPVFYRTFGGRPQLGFFKEAATADDANPRFVIIEHYRLSSFFGDYGAGKTVGVFSLMPGEETTLYIRNWRRSETTLKAASSIFDSHTDEAATEFETDLLAETTDTESAGVSRDLHSKYAGSGEVNLGFLKTKHSGEASDRLQLQSARETVSKHVTKVTTNHSSKASSKREIEVTQELEQTEAQEFETITERKIRNTNLSRTLNIVTRELNQEFTTYLSLVDVSLAFMNDFNVFDVFHIHEIDRMLAKYLPEPPTQIGDEAAPSPFPGISAYTFIRRRLIEQVNEVYDFRGTRHDFLEEVSLTEDSEETFAVGTAPASRRTYLRVRRPRRTDEPNPFYDPGFVPVEGIVMHQNGNTVRTPAVIIDSLLGHGVALDNYALGMQQEALRHQQNENRKTEFALALIEAGDEDRIEAFRSLFGSVDAALLREVALHSSHD